MDKDEQLESGDKENIKGEFSKLVRQDIQYRMAMSCKSDSKSFLILYEVIMMLKARLGEEPLKKEWGDKFEEKMNKLKELGKLISYINFFLMSGVPDERFKKEIDVADRKFVLSRRVYADVVGELDLLYETFYILLYSTNILKNLDIPNQYLRSDDKKQLFPSYRGGDED